MMKLLWNLLWGLSVLNVKQPKKIKILVLLPWALSSLTIVIFFFFFSCQLCPLFQQSFSLSSKPSALIFGWRLRKFFCLMLISQQGMLTASASQSLLYLPRKKTRNSPSQLPTAWRAWDLQPVWTLPDGYTPGCCNTTLSGLPKGTSSDWFICSLNFNEVLCLFCVLFSRLSQLDTLCHVPFLST